MPKKTARKSHGDNGDDNQRAARPFWSGTLTFGLVSVPVDLYPGNRTNRTPLRMLGPKGEPLARRYYSQKTERDLDNNEMVRGYETDKDKYVIVTDADLERLVEVTAMNESILSVPVAIVEDTLAFLLPISGGARSRMV